MLATARLGSVAENAATGARRICVGGALVEPLLQRVGTQPADEPAMQNWVDLMKRIAIIQSFVDTAKGANTRLALEPVFERLTKAANHVAVLAWSMESMHRRRFGGAIG